MLLLRNSGLNLVLIYLGVNMKSSKLFKGILAGSLLAAGVSARAEDALILKDGQWALYEAVVDNVTTCYAQTVDKVIFRAEDYFLEIAKVKNSATSPVELTGRIHKNKKGSTGLVIKSSAAAIALSDTTGEKERFRGVPKNLSGLIAQLRNGDKVEVNSVGGNKSDSFKITGLGFAKVIAEMEKRCNGGQALVNQEFESTFLGAVSASVDPTKLSKEKTTQLRAVYFSAYATFLQLKETNAALARVLAKYQPFIDELRSNRASLSQIENVDLPQSKQTLAASQKQQVDAKAEIARVDALLPGLTAKVVAAQKAYDEAKAILAPHVNEYNRITGNLNSAQSSLSEAQSRLTDIDNRLSNIANQISSLDNEADNLERGLPQRRMELDRARSFLRDAERRRAEFNVSFENERRLRNNSEYTRTRDERNQLIGILSQVENELNQIRGERERIRQMLAQCQAQPAPIPMPKPGMPGNEDAPPGVIGGIGPALPPTNPGQPSPNADCGKFEEALRVADAQVAEKERAQRDLANRKNQLENRMQEIERQTDREVRREYEVLVNREQEARRQVENLEDILRRDEARLSSIRLSEIPRLEREQSQLINERPSVISRINQASSDIDRLRRELAAFKAATDWDRKSANVDATARQLRADQGALSSAQQQKSNAQASLQAGINTEAQMKARIESLNAKVVSLNQRAVVLEDSIRPLAAERAPLDAKIAQLGSAVAAKQGEYLALLK
jgi:peptidoglycan hydrolase CwlO-like protein